MSSEVPAEVAADSSATAEAPANEGEGTADAGEVELAPWTAEAVTRPVVSWADASEEVLASVLSSGLEHPAEPEQSQGLSGEVEEEIIQPTSEVPVADDFSAEVAGDNAATDRVAGEITFSEVSGSEECTNNDLGLCKQEEDQQPLSSSSAGIVFQAADQLEGTEASNLGEDAIAAAVIKAEVDPRSPQADTTEAVASVHPETQSSGFSAEPVAVGSQEASEPACASAKPEVVDTAGVATETPGISVDSAPLGALEVLNQKLNPQNLGSPTLPLSRHPAPN